MELKNRTKGYLRAEGYDVGEQSRDLLVGTRKALGEDNEFIYVWIPAVGDKQSFASRERPMLERFKEANDAHQSAAKFMLVPNLEGLSTEFRSGAKRWYNVQIRTAVQFFDTPFRWDDSPEATSTAKDLRDRGRQTLDLRVAQPYSVDGADPGEDLLETLIERLRSPAGKKGIHLVVGPAGIGKTFLFESLFARLYNAFLTDKRQQSPSRRPMPLMPEYLRLSDAPTVKALMKAYLENDFSRPLSLDVFEWRLSHGFATWLLDGLDEVILQDRSFIDYLLDLITLPDSEGVSIVICVRDSLLATSPELREFCQDAAEWLHVYELGKWTPKSKRQFAKIALGSSADQFLGILKQRPSLDELASVPYFCALLSEEFAAGDLDQQHSEVSLLDQTVRRLIRREYQKGVLDENLLKESHILDFAQTLAAEDMANGFMGLSVESAREWAELSIPTDTPGADSQLAGLIQLAFFSRGASEQLRFTQELVEHFLLGQWYANLLRNNADTFVTYLNKSRQIPHDSVTLAVLREEIESSQSAVKLHELALQAQALPMAFKNIVQLLASVPSGVPLVRHLPFERQNLTGVVFDSIDLSGTSLLGADLTETEFRQCVMRDANLNDTILSNTGFFLASSSDLQGSDVGDLNRFYSIRVDKGRVLSTHKEARDWFAGSIGVPIKTVDPCQPALQLRHLFGKFVTAAGTARRSWLDRRGVLAGKRFYDPEEVLEAALRNGYLREGDRSRVYRPDGDPYSELIAYVSSLQLSPSLRIVLGQVCNQGSCSHVPAAA